MAHISCAICGHQENHFRFILQKLTEWFKQFHKFFRQCPIDSHLTSVRRNNLLWSVAQLTAAGVQTVHPGKTNLLSLYFGIQWAPTYLTFWYLVFFWFSVDCYIFSFYGSFWKCSPLILGFSIDIHFSVFCRVLALQLRFSPSSNLQLRHSLWSADN